MWRNSISSSHAGSSSSMQNPFSPFRPAVFRRKRAKPTLRHSAPRRDTKPHLGALSHAVKPIARSSCILAGWLTGFTLLSSSTLVFLLSLFFLSLFAGIRTPFDAVIGCGLLGTFGRLFGIPGSFGCLLAHLPFWLFVSLVLSHVLIL